MALKMVQRVNARCISCGVYVQGAIIDADDNCLSTCPHCNSDALVSWQLAVPIAKLGGVVAIVSPTGRIDVQKRKESQHNPKEVTRG